MTEKGHSQIDVKLLQELMKLMQDHGVHELEYQVGEFHVRLSRSQGERTEERVPDWVYPLFQSYLSAQQSGATLPISAIDPPQHQPQEAPEKGEEPEAEEENLHIIQSPIVGTFYRAPAPDAPPYVDVGDHVKKGQTLCIVEAMKIMNEIQSDIDGEIVKIFVANAAPVEYGQELFAIRPAHES